MTVAVYEGQNSQPESPNLFVKGVPPSPHPNLQVNIGAGVWGVTGLQLLSIEAAIQIWDASLKSWLELTVNGVEDADENDLT